MNILNYDNLTKDHVELSYILFKKVGVKTLYFYLFIYSQNITNLNRYRYIEH